MEQEKRRPGRPSSGITPKRDIRIGAIWDEARALATDRGEKMSALVTRALEREVRRLKREQSGHSHSSGRE
jgi:hypothetical protein